MCPGSVGLRGSSAGGSEWLAVFQLGGGLPGGTAVVAVGVVVGVVEQGVGVAVAVPLSTLLSPPPPR